MHSAFDVRPGKVSSDQNDYSGKFLCSNVHCDYGIANTREHSYSQEPFEHNGITYLHWAGLCLNCINDEVRDLDETSELDFV